MSSTSKSNDKEIIKLILLGQRDKYAELIDFYQSKIINLCLSFLRNPVEADEAAQEVFIKGYKSLRKFRGDSQFSTWLYRIAVHHCQDILRKKTRERTISWDELIRQKGDRLQDFFVTKDPSLHNQDDRDMIQRLLSTIKPESAQILILREIQGFSYQEVAQILNCSLDAVKSRLKRAREEIQKKTRHFLPSQIVKLSEVKHEP